MYKTLLIIRYLRKRRIAWVSLLAVMLCTTMVIVVMSVMGGWLNMFRESQRGLIGDIIISRRSWSGFPYYQEIIDEMMKKDANGKAVHPEIEAAVPVVQTYGLVNISDRIRTGVQVFGYPIDKIGQVNKFPQSLYSQYRAADDPHASPAEQQAARAARDRPPSFDPPLPANIYRILLNYRADSKDASSEKISDPAKWPGIIVGDGVVNINRANDGTATPSIGFLEHWVKLTVMGMDDEGGEMDVKTAATQRNYWIADNSRTKFYQQDQNTVYVPFNILQADLHMGPDSYTDITTKEKHDIPARASNIQVSVKPGVRPADVVPKIREITQAVFARHEFDPNTREVEAHTWEELMSDFINAIEHEIVLLTLLFSIMSIVAVFLIFCIFYMIVVEKTRDVGIIKSVGATSGGVAAIFLGYGLTIGVLGGGLGLLLSYLIVHNINELHAWMGRHMGLEMWNAKTYMFDSIPNTMDPFKVTVIVTVAVVASVIGSLIPAIRAARMNPVEALRWE